MTNLIKFAAVLLVSLVAFAACGGDAGEPVGRDSQALCAQVDHFWIDTAVPRAGGTCGTWLGSERPVYLAGETQLAYALGTGPTCWWVNNPTCTNLGLLHPGVFTGTAVCTGFTGTVPDYTIDFTYDLRTTPVTRTVRRYQDRRGGCSSVYDLTTHVTH